jgi:hypothetical protein
MLNAGVLVVLKTTDRLDDLLQGLRKAIIFMIMVYYNKRVKIKINTGQRCIGQSQGKTSSSPQLFSVSGITKSVLDPLAMMYGNMHEAFPTREAH